LARLELAMIAPAVKPTIAPAINAPPPFRASAGVVIAGTMALTIISDAKPVVISLFINKSPVVPAQRRRLDSVRFRFAIVASSADGKSVPGYNAH
jgi:hypothetical protein